MNEIDYERAALLMDVIAKCATIGIHNMALSGGAQRELNEINALAIENQKEFVEEQRTKEAEAAAARQAADNEDTIAQGRPVLKAEDSEEADATAPATPSIPRRA